MLTQHLAGVVRPALACLDGQKRWAWRGSRDLHDLIAYNQHQRQNGRPTKVSPEVRELMRLISRMSEFQRMDFIRGFTEKTLDAQGLTKQDYIGTGFHEEHGVIGIYATNKSQAGRIADVELVFVKGSKVVFRGLLDGSVYHLAKRCNEALQQGGWPECFAEVDNPDVDPRVIEEGEAPPTDSLARFIQARREQLGLTMRELALRCGLSKGYIRHLTSEQGRQTSPTLDTLTKLAKGLEVTPIRLVNIALREGDQMACGMPEALKQATA